MKASATFIPPDIERDVVLQMSGDVARTIYGLVGSLRGSGTYRAHTDAVYVALQALLDEPSKRRTKEEPWLLEVFEP